MVRLGQMRTNLSEGAGRVQGAARAENRTVPGSTRRSPPVVGTERTSGATGWGRSGQKRPPDRVSPAGGPGSGAAFGGRGSDSPSSRTPTWNTDPQFQGENWEGKTRKALGEGQLLRQQVGQRRVKVVLGELVQRHQTLGVGLQTGRLNSRQPAQQNGHDFICLASHRYICDSLLYSAFHHCPLPLSNVLLCTSAAASRGSRRPWRRKTACPKSGRTKR